VKLQVTHRTRYSYASPVRDNYNELRLQPVSDERQQCERSLLRVLPAVRLQHYTDLHANHVSFFELPEAHSSLEIDSQSVVSTRAVVPPEAPSFPLARSSECARMARCHDYLQASRFVDPSPEAWRMAIDATHGESDLWRAALAIRRAVFEQLEYEPGITSSQTHAQEVLRDRRGVCQDFAHVMIALCRSLSIPTAYVSGYLYNGPSETLRGAQASHAWCEVFVPERGWLGLDPTNDQLADERYVKLAVGRDYADAAPVRGHYRGAGQRSLAVEVLVERVGD